MYSDEVFAFIFTGFLLKLLCYLLTKEKFKTLFGNLAVFSKVLLATLIIDVSPLQSNNRQKCKTLCCKNLFFVRPFVKNC